MPSEMSVADLMTTDVVTLTEDETLALAQRCMARGRIRHPIGLDRIVERGLPLKGAGRVQKTGDQR